MCCDFTTPIPCWFINGEIIDGLSTAVPSTAPTVPTVVTSASTTKAGISVMHKTS